jgi:hypothetical protein
LVIACGVSLSTRLGKHSWEIDTMTIAGRRTEIVEAVGASPGTVRKRLMRGD